MNRPSPLISYAQNHEDIVLARLLQPWTRQGHWIDVGAGHPTFDSVTRLFSDLGWTGVNVEPLAEEFSLLCAERPNDINLNCAIGTRVGSATLYEGPPESRGTSTLIRENAFLSEESVAQTKTTEVEIRTLSSVLATVSWDIDFIKIDVEGMEADVIASADWDQVTASIVVVEATKPNSSVPSHQLWERTLLAADYRFRFFDGLNRYYSRKEFVQNEGGEPVSLWYPATAQDQFVRPERSELAELRLQLDHHTRTQRELREFITSLENHISAIREENSKTYKYVASLEKALEEARGDFAKAESYALDLSREVGQLRLSIAESEAKRLVLLSEISDLREMLRSASERIEVLSDN